MARKVMVELVGDERSLQRAFRGAERDATRFQLRMRAIGRSSGDIFSARGGAGGLTAFASSGGAIAVGLGVAGKAALDMAHAASNLNEQLSKSGVVFGDQADAIKAWSSTLASSFGIAQTEAVEAAATFGSLFRNTGQTEQAAAQFSKRLVELAGDLASFNNTTVDDALQALRSGLSGEIEPLRRYQVFLTEAAVAQRALADTHKRTVQQLTQGERVLARYELITQQTARATGDYARTAGSLANQERTLHAQLSNLQTKLGQGLVPVVTDVVSAFNDGIDVVEQFGSALDTLADVHVPGAGRSLGKLVKDLARVAIHGPDVAPLFGGKETQYSARGTPFSARTAVQRELFPTLPTIPRPVKLPAGPFGGAEKQAKLVELSMRLQLREVAARLSGSTQQLRKVLVDEVDYLRKAVTNSYGLTAKETLALRQATLAALGEIKSIDEQATAAREQAAAEAKREARELADKRRRAATAAREKAREAAERLKAFGVPLVLQVAEAQAQALGRDVKPILVKIKAAAQKALRSGRLGLEGQLAAWNTIADVNERLKQQSEALQKFIAPSAKQVVESLHLNLSPRDRAVLQQWAAKLGPTGKMTVPNQTAAFGYAQGGTNIYGPVYFQGVTDIKSLENELTKERNRSRTGTRRGTYGGRH